MSNRYDPCPPEDYGLVSESDINQNNTPTNYNLWKKKPSEKG